MNVLIGDIGNTNIKICLVELKTFKIKKLIHFNSINIYSKSFLKKILIKLLKIILLAKLHYFQASYQDIN